MTGDAPVTDKTTARPWAIMKIGSAAGISARIYAVEGMKDVAHIPMEWNGRTNGADAELIVAAVNSFDESRALLKEAANWIDHLIDGAMLDRSESEDFIARISAHLGE